MHRNTTLVLVIIGVIALTIALPLYLGLSHTEPKKVIPENEVLIGLHIAVQGDSYREGYLQALSDADSLELLTWEDFDMSIMIKREIAFRKRLWSTR